MGITVPEVCSVYQCPLLRICQGMLEKQDRRTFDGSRHWQLVLPNLSVHVCLSAPAQFIVGRKQSVKWHILKVWKYCPVQHSNDLSFHLIDKSHSWFCAFSHTFQRYNSVPTFAFGYVTMYSIHVQTNTVKQQKMMLCLHTHSIKHIDMSEVCGFCNDLKDVHTRSKCVDCQVTDSFKLSFLFCAISCTESAT